MSDRTTHSDLAKILADIAHNMAGAPNHVLCCDASSRAMVRDAARILVEQDKRIEELTVALRKARYAQ